MDNNKRFELIKNYFGWILFDSAFAPYIALGSTYQPLLLMNCAKLYLANQSRDIKWVRYDKEYHEIICGYSLRPDTYPYTRPPYISQNCEWQPLNNQLDIMGYSINYTSLPSFVNSISLIAFLFLALLIIPLTENNKLKRRVILSTAIVESISILLFLVCRISTYQTWWIIPSILQFLIVINGDICKIVFISYLPCLINKKYPQDAEHIPSISTYADTFSYALNFLFWPIVFYMDYKGFSNESIETISFGVMGTFSLVLSIVSWYKMEPIDEDELSCKKAMEYYTGYLKLLKQFVTDKNMFLYLFSFLIYKDCLGYFKIIFITGSRNYYNLSSMAIVNSIIIIACMVVLSNSIVISIAERFKISPKNILMVNLLLFALLGIYIYVFNHNIVQFYSITFMFGLIIGNYSSFYRAMQMQILPANYETRFLGILSIFGFGSGYIVPLFTGIVNDQYNNINLGFVVVVAPFLILAILILYFYDHEELRNKSRNSRIDSESYKCLDVDSDSVCNDTNMNKFID